MGNFFSSLLSGLPVFDKLFEFKEEKRIVMVGLDAAGKTTIVYKLKLGESLNTLPTIGFNVEQVQYKNITLSLWDIGGQSRIRPLWKHYFPGSHAIIYVVDSNDTARIPEARAELHNILQAPELSGAPLLVIANKQDLPNAMPVSQLGEQLGLVGVNDRQWWIQAACALEAEGLYEGLSWLSEVLRK